MKHIPVRHIDALQPGTDLTGSFRIRSVRELLAGKDMVQELHRHQFYFILVLEKGAGHHAIDFMPYPVSDRSVFLMRPGQVHEHSLKKGSTGYLVEFTADFYYPQDNVSRQLLRRVTAKNLCKPNTAGLQKLLSILSAIQHEHQTRHEAYPEAIKAQLGLLFIELIRQCQPGKGTAPEPDAYMQQRLDELMELVETHSAAHKQPSYYAALLHLSLYQLNALTKAALGKTSSALIQEHLVLQAKRYLLASSDQVKEIAFRLGYDDVSYFIRFFKKHTSLSPEAFRERFG